jgi:hypothetical protein
MLAKRPLRGVFGGLVTAIPASFKHELGSGVDDAQVNLSPAGRILIQATTDPTVTKVNSFLEQAVATVLSAEEGGTADEFTPSLDRTRDSLVLIVPQDAPRRLDDLNEACRQFDRVTLWPDANINGLNKDQKDQLAAARKSIETAYTTKKGGPPSETELVKLLSMIRVVRVDVADGGTDQHSAINLLRDHVLADQEQATHVWSFLVADILQGMGSASGADRAGIETAISNQGYVLLPQSNFGGFSPPTSVALAAEVIKGLGAAVRTPDEEFILGTYAKAELERLLVRTRRRVNFLPPEDYDREITNVANRCIEGNLKRAPSALRFEAVIYAVRANARQKQNEELARKLLAAAKQIEPSSSTKLAEVTLQALDDADGAILACRAIDSPVARTQLYILLNDRRREDAFAWIKDSGLHASHFNGVGVVAVAFGALANGNFDFAAQWIEEATDQQIEENPAVLFLRAQLRLAATTPTEHRVEIAQGMPEDFGSIVFSQTQAALSKRAAALADFSQFRERIKDLELPDADAVAQEYILWLELIDPSTYESAKLRLAEELRNPKLVMARARLGIAFGVPFDEQGLQAELARRRSIGGWTALEAHTALLLEMRTGDYSRVASFIDNNRAELEKAQWFAPGQLAAIEIEARARSGAVKVAEAKLQAQKEQLPENIYLTLERILAGLSGQTDEVATAKGLFEETGTIEHLRKYCEVLSSKKHFTLLPNPAAELARRTENARDLANSLRAYNNVGQWRDAIKLADNLSDVAPDDRGILLARVEAYFRIGDVLSARRILDQHFHESTDSQVVHLDIILSMESGEWGHIQGIVDRLRPVTGNFTPIELARLARLARDVDSKHWREFIDAALIRAEDDPNVYLAAYTLYTEQGDEERAQAHEWIQRAIELSGDDGPVQRKSLRDIVESAPDWVKREDYVHGQVKAGTAPLFIAARSLNVTVTNATLGRGLRNLSTVDATKRSSIMAFDGSHRAVDLSQVPVLALDLSALFTVSLLELTATVLDAYPKIVIGAGTLSLLFQERQSIRFHQPSRVAKAKRVKALLVKGVLKVLTPAANLPGELVKEVGEDLATMLTTARKDGGFVVRPGPLHKVGSFMDSPAEVGSYDAQLTDTREVLAFLRRRGAITTTVEKDATAYLHQADAGMRNAATLNGDVPLFLDELALTYLEYTSLLEPLTQQVGPIFISKRYSQEIEALLAYEELAEELLRRVDELSRQLSAGIKSGKVVINERNRAVEDDDEIRTSPSFSLLQSATAFNAIVVDDRALNYLPRWDVPAGAAAVATTVDLLEALVAQGKLQATDRDEAVRKLRTANFQLIPTSEVELSALLQQAVVEGDDVVETQEMLALRENLLSAVVGQQTLPRDEPWVLSARFALLQTIRRLWVETPATAAPKSTWLLSFFPSVTEFGPRPLTPPLWQNIRNQYVAEIVFLANGMLVPEEHRQAFFSWLTANIIEPIADEDPELFELVVDYFKKVMEEVADGSVE